MADKMTDQVHSISFDGKNTWDGFGLNMIPNTRPLVNPPEPKTERIDIPGGNGSINMSRLLNNYTVFKDREGSWEFTLTDYYNQYDYLNKDQKRWARVFSQIMNYLDGRERKVVLNDQPNFYYVGNVHVNKWDSDVHWSKITLDYTLDPFKYELTASDEDWLWDPFCFEDGIIREYKNLTSPTTLTIPPRRLMTYPQIYASNGNMSVKWNNMTFALKQGWNKFPAMVITPEHNTLQFTGSGTVTVKYRGGEL